MCYRTAIVIIALTLLPPVTQISAGQSSFQLIENAFDDSRIGYEERLVLLAQSVRAPQTLPVEFQTAVLEFEKCATDILIEVQKYWDQFSPENQAFLRDILTRPSRQYTYVSPDGGFKIHYDKTGTHAVPTTDTTPANGIPDFIEWIADYADSSFRTEVTNLGFRKPPIDNSVGGDSLYDIYTEEMGYYGYTQPEGAGSNPWNDWYSYISVHRNFYGFPPNDDPEGDQKGAAKVTVAHEYQHAIQLAYAYGDLWIMEACATWQEDYVFDPVNDNYNYLSYFMGYPHYSLHYGQGLHPYGAFVWPTFLYENLGDTVWPAIWEELISAATYTGHATVLAEHGTTLEDQFAEFTVWNYCTGNRNDGNHYEEASYYNMVPLVRTHSGTSYPLSGQTPNSPYRPDAMGCNYVRFDMPVGAGDFTVDFNGADATPWRVKILAQKYSGGYTFGEHEMTLDADGDGTFVLTDPESWDAVVMIVINVSQTLNNQVYIYGASFSEGSQFELNVEALADDSVYSNTSTTIMFEIEHRGSTEDDYDLSVSNNYGWDCSIVPSSIYLEPGQIDTVRASLVCPPLTLEGETVDVIVTADPVSVLSEEEYSDTAQVLSFIQHGDADNNGIIEITDAVHLITYIFVSGDPPVPVDEAGDADCNGIVEISDAVHVISYVFGTGDPPPCNPF